MPASLPPTVVLAGLESAGKSALFRGLTGQATGDEANFRGSTVMCRRCRVQLKDCSCEIVDTPGIRLQSDAETTRLALNATHEADVVLLVARGTDALHEVKTLLQETSLQQKRSALAMTFKDKAAPEIEQLVHHYKATLNIPVVLVNARQLDASARQEVLAAIEAACPPTPSNSARPEPAPSAKTVLPQNTWLEQPSPGPWLAIAAMALMFALPVYAAYVLAGTLQPFVDDRVITPLKAATSSWPPFWQAMITGGYGVVTLGWYSFLWAFPVVAFLSASVAIGEETGIKDRITAALDPWMRKIGLNGRDLIPVLTGFGCNVVAVFQSRACSACTRKRCVSMISFGSACSYQIGASISVFAAAGHPGLFIPYLLALMLAAALHTRLWYGGLSKAHGSPLHERAFLQRPTFRAVSWRMRAAMRQFLVQAMPIFLVICVVAASLEYFGVLAAMTTWLQPVMNLFHLPVEATQAILLSVLRKDGLLTLHQNEGAILNTMSIGQIFLAVWLASTLTACLVTLWTIRKELGWRTALKTAGRQMATSVATTLLIAAWL